MRKYLFFALVALVLVSCKPNNGRFLTSATGSVYECLVVCDDPVKEAVKDTMEADMYGLPQLESYFTVLRVPEEMFDSYLKASRNILKIDVDPRKYTKTRAITAQDVWSKPQAYIRINTPSYAAFLEYWQENGAAVREWFVREEIARQMHFIQAERNEKVQNVLKRSKYKMCIPSDYTLVQDRKMNINHQQVNVMQCLDVRSSTKHDLYKSILVYSYPYTSQEQFSNDSIIAMRDSVCRQLISGQVAGSYMKTEWKHIPPVSRSVNPVNDTTGGFYGIETRGLWKIQDGEAMGGPFVSLTRLDQVNGLVVHAEAFVYYPGEKKRTILRQMEAILYSLKMPNEK